MFINLYLSNAKSNIYIEHTMPDDVLIQSSSADLKSNGYK